MKLLTFSSKTAAVGAALSVAEHMGIPVLTEACSNGNATGVPVAGL
jgi:hypothetical protein